ncbi:MAG: electron transport complex subunit RsxG [Halioglobus sp.]|nr:electron transport complex subunit RsxG [Halioglobus sp.]
MLGRSITRNSVLLALFAIATTVLIVGTQLNTKDEIARQVRMAEEKALLQIIPREAHDNSMLDDTLPVGPAETALGLREEKSIYLARRNGQVVAAIIPATARDGYTDDIHLIVGVKRDGSIAGVRVLGHKETPGLGDKVDLRKSDWILSFDGRSIGNPTLPGWAVKKDRGDFDQFTGATITPRAVVAAVLRVLQFAETHRTTLFGPPTATSEQGAS